MLDEAAFHWRDVRYLVSEAPGDGVGLVRDAVEQGAARILSLGGDGTVHEAANGILSATVERLPPLGVVPAGTGNDYAKLLGTAGLPPREAVARIARGRVGYFDVGRAWDEYFLNAIGVGFDAEVARRVNGMKKLRGVFAYLLAAGQAFVGFRPFAARVEHDGAAFEDILLLVEIGIGPVVGGGFRLTPQALADDGLLDICAISRLSTLGFVIKLPLAMMGWHTGLKHVRTFRTTQLTLESLEGPLLAQLDGEVRSCGTRMEVSIEPRRLPVLIAGS